MVPQHAFASGQTTKARHGSPGQTEQTGPRFSTLERTAAAATVPRRKMRCAVCIARKNFQLLMGDGIYE